MSDVAVKMVDQTGEMKTYNSADGKFGFNMSRGKSYVITGDKEGYASTRASVSTMDVKRTDKDDSVVVTIYMDKVTPVYTFQVSNVFYDYDKSNLRPESVASLDSLANFLKDNPSFNVEIYSFADAKGTDKYNKDLSLKRAQSVVDYLTTAGIEGARMTAKGFGESLPAAPNSVGSRDNPRGRQLNRRTEVRVVTDVPTRRVLYNSAKPGNMNEQMNNLHVEVEEDGADNGDNEGDGSKLNK
jgi:outer membrane protein OmpA-like peptidoglycan-associated protein